MNQPKTNICAITSNNNPRFWIQTTATHRILSLFLFSVREKKLFTSLKLQQQPKYSLRHRMMDLKCEESGEKSSQESK